MEMNRHENIGLSYVLVIVGTVGDLFGEMTLEVPVRGGTVFHNRRNFNIKQNGYHSVRP